MKNTNSKTQLKNKYKDNKENNFYPSISKSSSSSTC